MQALVLVGFSVANYALLYVTSIRLAPHAECCRLRRLQRRRLLGAGVDLARHARTGEICASLSAGLAQSPGRGAVERVSAVFKAADPGHQSRAGGPVLCHARADADTARQALSRGDRHRGDVPARDRDVSIHPGGGSRLWRAIEGGRLLPDLVSGAVAPAQCRRLGFARGKRRRVCHVLLWRCLARRHCRAVPHDAKLLDRVSGALPDCARRLREHDLFAIAHLYAFHQSGPHRASRARGKRRAEPGAVHSAQRSLRGARRGHCLRGSRLAFACRLVAVRALRSRPLQACDVARDSCASAAHPLRAAPPRRTCRRAPTGWHPEAAPRRRPCRSPGLESTASPWLPPPRCWRSHD